jgi:hypothetical protein
VVPCVTMWLCTEKGAQMIAPVLKRSYQNTVNVSEIRFLIECSEVCILSEIRSLTGFSEICIGSEIRSLIGWSEV